MRRLDVLDAEVPDLPPPPYVPVECSRDVPELEAIDGARAHTCACWFPLPVTESAGLAVSDDGDGAASESTQGS